MNTSKKRISKTKLVAVLCCVTLLLGLLVTFSFVWKRESVVVLTRENFDSVNYNESDMYISNTSEVLEDEEVCNAVIDGKTVFIIDESNNNVLGTVAVYKDGRVGTQPILGLGVNGYRLDKNNVDYSKLVTSLHNDGVVAEFRGIDYRNSYGKVIAKLYANNKSDHVATASLEISTGMSVAINNDVEESRHVIALASSVDPVDGFWVNNYSVMVASSYEGGRVALRNATEKNNNPGVFNFGTSFVNVAGSQGYSCQVMFSQSYSAPVGSFKLTTDVDYRTSNNMIVEDIITYNLKSNEWSQGSAPASIGTAYSMMIAHDYDFIDDDATMLISAELSKIEVIGKGLKPDYNLGNEDTMAIGFYTDKYATDRGYAMTVNRKNDSRNDDYIASDGYSCTFNEKYDGIFAERL